MDLRALADFTDWQIREGVHGLIPLGSTGEFLSLGEDERVAVAETVIRTAAGRVPVLVGTGAEDTREAVRLSRQAEALGIGMTVVPPLADGQGPLSSTRIRRLLQDGYPDRAAVEAAPD